MDSQKLREVLELHGKYLRGENGGERADLQNADLQNANLRYANLQGANLRYANLQNADLQNADLRYANLQNADLQGANLRYANLQGANLRYANLQGANLRYANLQGANLRYANLQNADLQNANLQNANLQGANLLDGLDFEIEDLPSLLLSCLRLAPDGQQWPCGTPSGAVYFLIKSCDTKGESLLYKLGAQTAASLIWAGNFIGKVPSWDLSREDFIRIVCDLHSYLQKEKSSEQETAK